jgi:hypothetical protein
MIAVAIWCGGLALVVLAWALFRKGGYKRSPLDAPPGPDWQRTEERFVDPSSGEVLDVWFHPPSGSAPMCGRDRCNAQGQTEASERVRLTALEQRTA